jgi:lipopolysaccharide biosynthesis glycosyltransferase
MALKHNSFEVVMASDSKYFTGLFVAAASPAYWLPGDMQLNLHVFASRLSPRCQHKLQSILNKWQPSAKVCFHSVESLKLEQYSHSHGFHFTAIARLFMPKIIKSDANIIYLDIDTVCLGDISSLFTLDLGDLLIAACREYGDLSLADDCPLPLEGERDRSAPYYNTGILIINPRGWNGLDVTRQCLELLKRSDLFWRLADQSVLNYVGTPEKAKSIPAQLVSGMRRR